jgi:MFS transporter, SHS family, lactate transporter
MTNPVNHSRQVTAGPWYRQVSKEQWKAFNAAFWGWVLDGFDFTLLMFVLIDIQQSFTIDSALAGALGTVTMMTRLVGGVAAGTAADRWGRKRPLMVSILWFSIFSLLSGFSTSYAMLFAFRALFGIGMGGEYAAGVPLAMEHWPTHLRGIASGILQGGFSWGYILSALAFRYLYPLFNTQPGLGWRALFWIGALPALLVLWIRSGVSESPIWLERRRLLSQTRSVEPISLLRVFHRDLLGTTIQTSLLISAFMVSVYSISFWYPTYLRQSGLEPFWYIVALNLGNALGATAWGRMSETRLGRRGSVTGAGLLAVVMIPAYMFATNPALRLAGALLMGFTGPGMGGAVPTYLSERFPTAVRGVGPGFAYHAGAGIGSITPMLIGLLHDRGIALNIAMSLLMVGATTLAIAIMWLGPETRGREFRPIDSDESEPRSIPPA